MCRVQPALSCSVPEARIGLVKRGPNEEEALLLPHLIGAIPSTVHILVGLYRTEPGTRVAC